jgi:hypothetical protein
MGSPKKKPFYHFESKEIIMKRYVIGKKNATV